MKRMFLLTAVTFLFVSSTSHAGFMDNLTRELVPAARQSSLDDGTIAKGLKEALATGTERAVKEVARTDGYFGNQLIRILLPEKVQQVANVLSRIGYQQEVDSFVMSMNRAAEKAAPKAAGFFGDAIRKMSLEDARAILSGDDTAATRYFEKHTRPGLYNAFKPVVVNSMEQVGTARTYKNMIGRYEGNPLASLTGAPDLDLNNYVTNKALDGLFKMVGEEEKKIRSNPAARSTELLRKVFGGK